MHSSTGPILVIVGAAVAVVLALVVVQTMGIRGELEAARGEVAALQAQVDGLERGVPLSELSMRMAELENDVREWVLALSADVPVSGDPSSPAGGSSSDDELLDRLDEVLAAVEALDARVDEICEGVPVC